MSNDLLEARACVDWAMTKLPSFGKRLEEWVELNVSAEIQVSNPQNPYHSIVAVEKEPLPLSFNVEVGAYINAMRTSLHLLATGLARRFSIPRPDQVYFPFSIAGRSF